MAGDPFTAELRVLCSLREDGTGSWRWSGMEHSAVRTREQSFTTAATLVSGRCSSLVSDVCHFGRDKRERGQEPDPWGRGGGMYGDSIRGTPHKPFDATDLDSPSRSRSWRGSLRAATLGVCMGPCDTCGTCFLEGDLSPPWPSGSNSLGLQLSEAREPVLPPGTEASMSIIC